MELIEYYFPDITKTQKDKFATLWHIYQDWNKKINVISRKDIDNLYLHHVLHSLAIAKVVNFHDGAKILDVGTGGGFPGIPLAIMFPKVRFLLVDSISKKLKVVDSIKAQEKLDNIETFWGRAEQAEGSFDFAVSRAVAPIDKVFSWVSKKIDSHSNHEIPNGLLYLKGDDISYPTKLYYRKWDLKDIYQEDYFKEKVLVLLSPIDAKLY